MQKRAKKTAAPPDWSQHRVRAEYQNIGKKPYRILHQEVGGWHRAVCLELVVSGFGDSKEAALEAVTRSIRSTLRLHVKQLKDLSSLKKIATVYDC